MSKSKISRNAALSANAELSAIFAESNVELKKVGARRFANVRVWLENNPEDLILAATTPSVVGVKVGTTEARILSDVRGIYSVAKYAPADFALIAEFAPDAGWDAIMLRVREVRKSIAAAKSEAREAEAVAKVAAKVHKSDPAAAAALIEQARQQREADRIAAANAPKVDKSAAEVAANIAKRLVRDRGAEFAREVAAALESAIDAAVKSATTEAVAA